MSSRSAAVSSNGHECGVPSVSVARVASVPGPATSFHRIGISGLIAAIGWLIGLLAWLVGEPMSIAVRAGTSSLVAFGVVVVFDALTRTDR